MTRHLKEAPLFNGYGYEKFWFFGTQDLKECFQIEESDKQKMMAMVVNVIGEKVYPVIEEWGYFTFAGAIASANNKWLKPENFRVIMGDTERLVWKELWSILAADDSMDIDFKKFILRSFIPRDHRATKCDGGYYKSLFSDNWTYHDKMFSSTGQLRIGILREGEKIFKTLPDSDKREISKISNNFQTSETLKFMKTTYQY